jgi:NADH dehydrogenase
MEWLRPGEQQPPRILILGGGFAGVYTGYELQRRLRRSQAELAIVNRENFFVFYPLLPEIISGSIAVEAILNPIRLVVPAATLYVGEVTDIDLAERRVTIRHGLYQHQQAPRALYYDHLVLALGGVPATFGIPGLAENAFDVQRLSNAFALRNHLIDVLEQADIETNPLEKRRLLTVVVIGGGSTGVEVASEVWSLFIDAVRYYRHIEPEDFRVVIVQAGPRLIPEFPAKLGDYAARLLTKRGVEVLLDRKVVRVEPEHVELDDGTIIPAHTIIGSVGVQPNPLVRNLGVEVDRRGRVVVDEFLRVPGYDNVWALGDNALALDPETGEPYPQTAQHAVQEAKVVADNIAATLRGRPLKRMEYRTRGMLVSLGHRSAAGSIRGWTFSGFFAWWLWRTYYLLQLPRWERRLRVAFDWTLDLFFPPELVQLKVGQPAPAARRLVQTALRRGQPQPVHE